MKNVFFGKNTFFGKKYGKIGKNALYCYVFWEKWEKKWDKKWSLFEKEVCVFLEKIPFFGKKYGKIGKNALYCKVFWEKWVERKRGIQNEVFWKKKGLKNL